MSNLFNRIVGNLATRMMLIIYVSIVLITLFFIIFSYFNELELQESRQYDKLKALVSAASVHIDGDEHEKLMNRYDSVEDSLAIRTDSFYVAMSQQMGEVVKLNELSPMYTLVYNEELDSFLYGIRSDNFIDFKNTYKLTPKELVEGMETGGVIPKYETENGTWLSAFHPIRNSEGEVVAIVEADIDFQEFQTIVNERYMKEVMIAVIVIFLFALFLIPYTRKVLNEEERQRLTLLNQKILIESKNRDLMDSIRYALKIQTAILPPVQIFGENQLDGFIYHRAKDVVAGDFYWIERHGDYLFMAVADCTGHGVPGAILSLICSNSLNRAVDLMKLTDTGEILDACRKMIIRRLDSGKDQMSDGMDVALCRLNVKTLELQYSGANNPVYLFKQNLEELIILSPDKQPCGNYPAQRPFKSETIQLHKNDFIFMFTDGFADQFGGSNGKKFKYAAFKQILLENVDKSASDQRQLLENTLIDWMQEYEQVDDICVMGVRI